MATKNTVVPTSPLPSPFRFGFLFGLGFILSQVVFYLGCGVILIGFAGFSLASLMSGAHSGSVPVPMMQTESAPASPEAPPAAKPAPARPVKGR